ncbi:MurR/RpiR family transcriptional regulator [Amycolatopsis sp. GM8]|uniref:MurR/RpiR family transcriptional regulator n=1 Tax=Amycolatopsis sp. GM8 TaxID=2896530 RepID=UPI001F33D1B2|nr:MurR/RpiR family transcriptional regulator [Amycolatopsis sp. GM8]
MTDSDEISSPGAGAQPPAEALARIRSAAPELRGVARRVADIIVRQPNWVVSARVADLAEAADASASSVVRACRDLGFDGFPDLKIVLARDLARTEGVRFSQGLGTEEGETGDPGGGILEKVLRGAAQSLIDAISTVDNDTFETVADLVAHARRILFVAVGTSRTPAVDAASRLTTIGLHAFAPDDVWLQQVQARQLSREDVCIAISRTGTMRPTLEAAEMAREGGATTVAMTSFHNAPLAAACDYALISGAPELGFRIKGMTSQLALLAVLDALYGRVASLVESRAAVGFQAITSVTDVNTVRRPRT